MKDKWELRLINTNDDYDKVSDLIFETDPFIYPDFAVDKTTALAIIKALIQKQIGIFNSENLFVCLFNDALVGIVLVLNKINKSALSDVRQIYNELGIDFTEKQAYLWVHYFEKLEKNSDIDKEVYISNVCVASEYQNKGIATVMLNYIFERYSESKKTIALHVLEQNVVGIHLYEKMGFVKKTLIEGYSSVPGETNLCYLMVKEA